MIIIQRRNTHPINMNAHAAIQLWPVGYKLAQHIYHTGEKDSQILCCSNHASVSPLTPADPGSNWQVPFTPLGPHSSILYTTRPTIQRINRMKEPIITIPGRSCRWEMSHSMMRMKRRPIDAEQIQYGKYLHVKSH
jgi:hypothetical protein